MEMIRIEKLKAIMEDKIEALREKEGLKKELVVGDLLSCTSEQYFNNLIQQTNGVLTKRYGQSLSEEYGIKVFFIWNFDEEKMETKISTGIGKERKKTGSGFVLSKIGPGYIFGRKTIFKKKHISKIRREVGKFRYLIPKFFLYKEKKI